MRAHPVFFLHQRGWIICACLCTCLCAVIPTIAQAQTGQQTRATMVPGLFAKYSDGSNVIQRIESNPKWDSESRASDPRFPSDAVLDVQWTGLLQIKEAGLYRMHVFASGKASLLLQEKKLLEIDASDQPSWHQAEIDLPVGQHPIQLDFRAEGNSEIGLFWSGGNFGLEPIPTRLLQHRTSENDVTRTHQLPSGSSFKTGSKLFRALRCAACHDAATGADGEEPDPTLRAPSLRKLQNNLRPSWLVRHLTEQAPEPGEKRLPRRMPYFALDKNSAMAISAALFAASEKSFMPLSPKIELEQRAKKRRKKDSPVRTVADVDLGGEVFASQGCLACHEADGLGIPSNLDQALFGGGDLSKLAVKRTASSVLSILQDPAMGNAQHRMPKFELDALQQLDLHAYLTSLGAEDSRNDTRAAGDVDRGVGLIAKHRCGACHELPDSLQSKVQSIAISDASNWISGCLQQANARGALPGYGLSEEHRDAIRNYVSERNHRAHPPHQLLAENNCLGCHARNEERGIVSHLIDVVEEFPGTASKLAALSPPSLNAVGDKLTDEALLSTIQGEQKPLRDWLEVQMPTFPIEVSDARSIANYLIAQDRVPANVHSLATKELSQSAELAASRLVTSQGFGCQSCHAVGPFETPKVDLKARGPNLSMLGNRVRESWFHRWVRNPSRIVPRMEMPAIQTPVTGLLNNDLDQQLDALWQTLNKPDFVPPRPNAERVVQNHNVPGSKEHANLVACVIESEAKNYLRPLAIGLPNRQNVLFDLEAGHWVAWWLGDTAAQYTRGKTWYWELGGPFLNSSGQSANSDAEPRPPVLQEPRWESEEGELWVPVGDGQVATRLDRVRHVENGLTWSGGLTLGKDSQRRNLEMHHNIFSQDQTTVIDSSVEAPYAEDTRRFGQLWLDSDLDFRQDGQTALHQGPSIEVRIVPDVSMQVEVIDGRVVLRPAAQNDVPLGPFAWKTIIGSALPSDSLPKSELVLPPIKPRVMECLPGYEVVRLPLTRREMPISLAWGPEGELFVGSLKGNVLRLRDTDGDGLEDKFEVISDNLPTPYGLQVTESGQVDALAKFALLRLSPSKVGSPIWDTEVIADGWGYTADYHDWAVGLERDSRGNYSIVLPCQQDERSEAAAKWRGHALKLIPSLQSESPRSYRVESFASGLRFPMGLVQTPEGDLFATDNQGNYNPFNELNHLRPGKRYGFINKLENKDGFSPPFESPAINLPHPWSRSVNGICLLNTPGKLKAEGVSRHFGPFEGHLVGSEMNGRSLIRMSLQLVNGNYQGAAYNFSLPGLDSYETFEGPIVCEVSPAGDIYVGNLHDSGWGGGQNTGSIVRVRPTGKLPLGIAEVRATATGFQVDFTGPVDSKLALDPNQYQIRSYRRISTPAYGGDDQDEQPESIQSLQPTPDGTSIRIELDSLRAGFVYEINIGPIGDEAGKLFPAQAHYTMRSVPRN